MSITEVFDLPKGGYGKGAARAVRAPVKRPTTQCGGSFAAMKNAAYVVTGNKLEAELLERIWFWYPKAVHKDADGVRWLIRTAQEFRDDGVLSSLDAIWKALRRLEGKGLIARKRGYHHFDRSAGKMAVTYLRLVDLEVCAAHSSNYAEDTLRSVRSAQFLIQGNLQGNIQGNTPADAVGGPPPAPIPSEIEEEKPMAKIGVDIEEENSKPKFGKPRLKDVLKPSSNSAPKSAAEAVADIQAKGLPRARTDKALTSTGVHRELAFWMKDTWPTEIAPEQSAKRLGWCGQALDKFRAHSCTDAQVLSMLQQVVQNFSAFRDFTKKRIGWNLAERPTHLMLVQQADMIIQWCAETGEQETAKPAKKPQTLDEWYAAKKGK